MKRVMIDGTERPIQRPQDKKRQQENYSGKKRRVTRKHLVAVDESKRVLALSRGSGGSSARKTIV